MSSTLPAEPTASAVDKPVLVFFTSQKCGRCRHAESFLAQVLQHRGNHHTFAVHRIDYDGSTELAKRLTVEQPPAVVVLQGSKVLARVDKVKSCAELRQTLAPWLK